MTTAKRKIALLGGGIASLSAAFALTSRPEFRQKYDLCVYQLGFRLGGKGASGCNPALHDRIEEHGLHVWMGFYDNAFRLIRQCYEELGREPGHPLATWRDTFAPHDFVTWEERVGGEYRHWFGPFPPNPGEPGDGAAIPTPWQYVLKLVPRMLRGWQHMKENPTFASYMRDFAVESAMLALYGAHRAASAAIAQGPSLLEPLARLRARVYDLVRGVVEQDDHVRRMFVGLDLIHALTRGMIVDEVVTRGFDVIDGEDFRAWLRRHGAADWTLHSGLVTALYDFVFAYADGHPDKPAIGAGTILRITLRMLFAYRGSVFYRMQAGMGESVFVPLYEVLRRRGVRFEFFRRIDRLGLSPDCRHVETIDMTRQATVKRGEYEPLVRVGGIDRWPIEPCHEQLVEGNILQRDRIDLESYWTSWSGVGSSTLRRGIDFDDIVLGIPIGALEPLCGDICDANPRFRRMLSEVKTVRTQAMQLWLSRDLRELGWSKPGPLLTAYAPPHSTWADFTHLLPRENWPAEGPMHPKNLAYFCGPMASSDVPPASAHEFPEQARRRALREGTAWMERHLGHLWPRAMDDQGQFDWALLLGQTDATGPERLETQYVRANVNPWDLYVQSLPGTARFRLRADESGVGNLYLAGDWVRTGLDLGCIEAAVMSGLQAARAISGYPHAITGESDFS